MMSTRQCVLRHATDLKQVSPSRLCFLNGGRQLLRRVQKMLAVVANYRVMPEERGGCSVATTMAPYHLHKAHVTDKGATT